MNAQPKDFNFKSLRFKKAEHKYLNQRFQMLSGEVLTVIEYLGATNITVQFDNGTIVEKVSSGNINNGLIKNPNQTINKIVYSDRTRKEYYLNKRFQMNNSEWLTVIKYIDQSNITIQFDDETIVENVTTMNIKEKRVKNPNTIKIKKIPEFKGLNYKGTFYVGKGKYDSTNNEFYNSWRSMQTRCYNYKMQEKNPTYIDCTIDPIWHNFQNFAKWCEINYVKGFQLDKDILIKGNKIYGPDTCCFVPKEINSFFIKHENKRTIYPIGVSCFEKKQNVKVYTSKVKVLDKIKYLGEFDSIEKAFQAYKKEKERYIKWLALTWKNKILEKVFNTLMKYEVDMDD